MKKLAVTVSLLAALALVPFAAAALIPREPNLPPGWSHADINVVINHQAHTLTYDRGRVLAVSGSSLTLRERDGSVQTIDVSPTARITIDGRPAVLSQVRRRELATTVAIDGGPAVSVKVAVPPALRALIFRQNTVRR